MNATVKSFIKLKETAASFAVRNNCVAGVCPVSRMQEVRAWHENRFTPFITGDIEKRIDPAKHLPGVKSAVVLGINGTVSKAPPLSSCILEPTGILSTLGTALDYHAIIKKSLLALVDELRLQGSFRYKILVDNGMLDERALAVKAGLGYWGRSGMVISPVLGPCFNIGCLLTDIPLDPESKSVPVLEALTNDVCQNNCRSCLKKCPSGALTTHHFGPDAENCVSYLTQKKELLTEAEMKKMGNQLYGCDICRRVCPLQAGLFPPEERVPLMDCLTMNQKAFDERFGHTAMMWRGVEVLRRNALIVLGNTCGYGSEHAEHASEVRARFLPLIQSLQAHPDKGVKAAADYAYKGLFHF